MQTVAALAETDRARLLAELKARIAVPVASNSPLLPFGVDAIDSRLSGGGLDGGGLHEVAAASPTLGDDAAATLFVAGAAARFAADANASVAWTLTRFDLYAPGLEQGGLPPRKLLYCEGRDEVMALALAEDCLRDGSFAAVVAEVKNADQTAMRRLQLAAADGHTPMLMLRRWARAARDPLEKPSAACTRWRIGCAPSVPLTHPGVGRSCWSVELVRQRGGNSFSLIVEACDGQGSPRSTCPSLRSSGCGGSSGPPRRLSGPGPPRRSCRRASTTIRAPARSRAAGAGAPARAGRRADSAGKRKRPGSRHCLRTSGRRCGCSGGVPSRSSIRSGQCRRMKAVEVQRGQPWRRRCPPLRFGAGRPC